MNRYFSLLLCLALCCALSACGNPPAPITAVPTTTHAETTTQAPTETQIPTPTKDDQENMIPVYVPGSIELDEGNVSEFQFKATKRYVYYCIPGLLSDLAPEGAITELFEKDKDPSKEPQEMVLVTLIKYCNISRQNFDKAVEQLIEQYTINEFDMTNENFEIPNADIIYTFDNEIINEYYRRQ